MALEQEFSYFRTYQDELVEKYNGKFLIIKDQTVVGVYNTKMEAYTEAKKKYELGTFLIQLCIAGPSAYTQTFHSRVVFA